MENQRLLLELEKSGGAAGGGVQLTATGAQQQHNTHLTRSVSIRR
jgi:hypothetical protein